MQTGRDRQPEPVTAEPRTGLSADVEQFVSLLKSKYPNRIRNRP